jgi:hypothetical protein
VKELDKFSLDVAYLISVLLYCCTALPWSTATICHKQAGLCGRYSTALGWYVILCHITRLACNNASCSAATTQH